MVSTGHLVQDDVHARYPRLDSDGTDIKNSCQKRRSSWLAMDAMIIVRWYCVDVGRSVILFNCVVVFGPHPIVLWSHQDLTMPPSTLPVLPLPCQAALVHKLSLQSLLIQLLMSVSNSSSWAPLQSGAGCKEHYSLSRLCSWDKNLIRNCWYPFS